MSNDELRLLMQNSLSSVSPIPTTLFTLPSYMAFKTHAVPSNTHAYSRASAVPSNI